MERNQSEQEQRKFPRLQSSLPLKYRNLKNNAQESILSATAKNISEGGICFNSSEFISLACRLVVEINLPAAPKPIKAISKVAWIRKLPQGKAYELGNQFLDMAKEDKSQIVDFVKAEANKPTA